MRLSRRLRALIITNRVSRHLRVAGGAVGALVLAASQAAAQQVIWRGRSGGFDVTWTDRDVSARRASDGALVFSAKAMADRAWSEMSRSDEPGVAATGYGRKFRLVSVVGSIISLEDAEYCECGGAHPIAHTRFVAYDLARSTPAHPREAAVTDVAPEAELVRALEADRLIRAAMDSAHVRGYTSLAGLTRGLQFQEIEAPPEGCTYAIGESFPAEWAIHHLEGGRAAIRFSLSHDVEVCRGRYVQVGVLVAPNARIRSDLAAADARRAGYLAKDLAAIARGRDTDLAYARRRSGR